MEAIYYSLESTDKAPNSVNFERLEASLSAQLGNNLKCLRQSFGYTQNQHAKILGVSLSQYRKYEAGKDIPRFHTICRWSMLTGASFYSLFKGTGYETLLPEYLCSWKLLPFNHVIARLKDQPFMALVNLTQSLQLTQEIVIAKTPLLGLDEMNFDQAFNELERDSYIMIALQLRLFRQRRGYTQELMAEMLGININSYRNYENPNMAPKFSVVFALRFFLVFGIHPTSLMPDSQFYQVLSQQLSRLKFLASTIHQLSDRQFQQLKTIFASVEALAQDGDAYLL